MKKILLNVIALFLCGNTFGQWTIIESPKGIQVNRFYQSSDSLFAGTSTGLFTQKLNKWVKLNEDFNSNVTSVLKHNKYLYAGTTTNGIYRSNDLGRTWLKVNNGITSNYVQDIKLYKNLIAAGTDGGIFFSDNNGLQWTNKSSNLPNKNVKVILEFNDSLFVGTGNGIYSSKDSAKTWNSKNTGLGSNRNVSAMVSVGSKLFVSFIGSGVYLSTDNAKNWVAVNTQLTSKNVNALYHTNDTLFAGTTDSLYYATDLTNIKWKVLPLKTPLESVSAIIKNNNSLIVGNSYGSYKYLNLKFNDMNDGFPNLIISKIFSIDTSFFAQTNKGLWRLEEKSNIWSYTRGFPNNIQNISRFDTSYISYTENGLFISDKNLKIWKQISNKTNITCLAASNNFIFLGTKDEGIFRSSDKGKTWLPVNIGIDNMNIKNILSMDNHLFAVSDKLYKSTDYGDQWTGIGDPFTYYFIANKGATLYRGYTINDYYYTLYKSNDYANTWSTALKNSSFVGGYKYVINNPSNLTILDSLMFCFTDGGINISYGSDTSWYRINKGYDDTISRGPTPINEVLKKGNDVYLRNAKNNIWKREISTIQPLLPPTDVKYFKDKNNNIITINWKDNSANEKSFGIRRYWDFADIKVPNNTQSIKFDIDTLSESSRYFEFPFYMYANDNGDWSPFSKPSIEDKRIASVSSLQDIKKYSLFPNPVTSLLHINTHQGGLNNLNVEIYNSLGILVFSKKFAEYSPSIDFTKFDPGFYILEINDVDNRLERFRILKE